MLPFVLSLVAMSGETLRGVVKIGDLVEGDEEPQPSMSDNVLVRPGLPSIFPPPLDRSGRERVPAAPISFSPVVSSIGSETLSA